MYTIKYTLSDGSERFDCNDSMATALFCAFEYPIENAVRAEVTGPDGFCRIYLLKG